MYVCDKLVNAPSFVSCVIVLRWGVVSLGSFSGALLLLPGSTWFAYLNGQLALAFEVGR